MTLVLAGRVRSLSNATENNNIEKPLIKGLFKCGKMDLMFAILRGVFFPRRVSTTKLSTQLYDYVGLYGDKMMNAWSHISLPRL